MGATHHLVLNVRFRESKSTVKVKSLLKSYSAPTNIYLITNAFDLYIIRGTMNEASTASFIEMKGVNMQRHGILNSHIAKILADLGHTDTICISDCGLPVPEGVQKIDLALDFGVPSFEQVVSIIAKHMKSEAVYVAKEIKEHNPEAYDFLESTFPSNQYEWVETSHEAFKEATKQCKCIIRTGEASPYANIILRADCIFSDRP